MGNGLWDKYTDDELKAMWQAEVDADETNLTLKEWTVRFIMEQATKEDTKKPVDNSDQSPSVDEQMDEAVTIYKEQVTKGNTSRPFDEWHKAYMKHDNDIDKANGSKKKKKEPLIPEVKGEPKPVVDMSDDKDDTESNKNSSNEPVDNSNPNRTSEKTINDLAKELGLTDKQEMFCRHYVGDAKYNGAEAARLAGYKSSHRQQASDNLSKPYIQRFIAELQKPVLNKLDISKERILREYHAIAFSNLFDFVRIGPDGLPYVDMSEITREQMSALSQADIIQMPAQNEGDPEPLKIKLKLNDKLSALDTLAKIHGVFKEKVEVSGEVHVKGDNQDIAMRLAYLLRQAQENVKNN